MECIACTMITSIACRDYKYKCILKYHNEVQAYYWCQSIKNGYGAGTADRDPI